MGVCLSKLIEPEVSIFRIFGLTKIYPLFAEGYPCPFGLGSFASPHCKKIERSIKEIKHIILSNAKAFEEF
eukprot:SAG22_NODE_2_length_61565_cov_858.782010_19_plen_71_part_00